MEDYKPKPQVNHEAMAQLEDDLLARIKQQSEADKLEERANQELGDIRSEVSNVSFEQIFLMMAAGVIVISIAFIHTLIAIVLALLAVAIALVTGLSSSRDGASSRINLFTSLVGLVVFQFAAIFSHTIDGDNNMFALYQFLAFLFLLATYFSARTFRKKVIEQE